MLTNREQFHFHLFLLRIYATQTKLLFKSTLALYPQKQTQKTLALWAIIILTVISIVVMLEPRPQLVKDVGFNDFLQAALSKIFHEVFNITHYIF